MYSDSATGDGTFELPRQFHKSPGRTRHGAKRYSRLSFFMNVPVSADGQMTIAEGSSKPGDYVDLRCEWDVLVVISMHGLSS